jgi:aminoglycoside 6'-N-acetyltransferase
VGLLSYRPAVDGDVPLLVRWHADPEVSRYWDGETFTADEMRARLARPDVDTWILEENGEPVGLLQSWWEPDLPRRGGIDGFLIQSARGRGVMPAVARELASDLVAQGWVEVTVDPYEGNERAIRGWEKAGFVEVSRGHPPDEDHSGPWVLMRFSG